MSWQAVARKDFRDAIRSRAFWAVSALFVLLTVVVAVAIAAFPDAVGLGDPSARSIAFFASNTVATFIAITAILLCYKSIAGERDGGSIKLLLSLPHTRGEVVLGKVVGRTAVLAVPVVFALGLASIVGWVAAGAFDPVVTVLLLLVAVLFSLTYVSIMVGLSAATGSSGKAAALTLGVFFVFEFVWDIVVLVLAFAANDFAFPQNLDAIPAWLYPVNQLKPTEAFLTTLDAVVPGGTAGAVTGNGGVIPSAGSLDAFYATPWVGLVALLLWLIVPLAVGTRLFSRADL